MNRKTLFGLVGAIIFLILGVFVGFLIGTSIGGNYFPDFELWTWRGYEATGWIGILVGGLFGAFFGTRAGIWMANRQSV